MMLDHYETLRIQRNASLDEIKKAYHQLALQYHPDKCGQSAEFIQISDAYGILSNEDSKIIYDAELGRESQEEKHVSSARTMIRLPVAVAIAKSTEIRVTQFGNKHLAHQWFSHCSSTLLEAVPDDEKQVADRPHCNPSIATRLRHTTYSNPHVALFFSDKTDQTATVDITNQVQTLQAASPNWHIYSVQCQQINGKLDISLVASQSTTFKPAENIYLQQNQIPGIYALFFNSAVGSTAKDLHLNAAKSAKNKCVIM